MSERLFIQSMHTYKNFLILPFATLDEDLGKYIPEATIAREMDGNLEEHSLTFEFAFDLPAVALATALEQSKRWIDEKFAVNVH
jgi:hypothetical protein